GPAGGKPVKTAGSGGVPGLALLRTPHGACPGPQTAGAGALYGRAADNGIHVPRGLVVARLGQVTRRPDPCSAPGPDAGPAGTRGRSARPRTRCRPRGRPR